MATIYAVKRKVVDPNAIKNPEAYPFAFEGGASYKGEWKDNRKGGFGVEVAVDGTKYEGEWQNGQYGGKGTQWVIKDKRTVKQYEGEWQRGKMHGMGRFHYPDGKVYRGGFENGHRSGRGRLEYTNGDVYTGEWALDVRAGAGTMTYANGNVYDGRWLGDKKEGPGRYFYGSTRKVYEGEWADDAPVCGSYRAPTESEMKEFGVSAVRLQGYELPEIGLANARGVLDLATTGVRLDRAQVRGTKTPSAAPIGMSQIAAAEDKFAELAEGGAIAFAHIGPVLALLGCPLSDDQLEDLRLQLEIDAVQPMGFPDIADISNFLQ